MIITLKGADFTSSNIGTLSTWSISRVLGLGATYTGAKYVEKNASLDATVTLAAGYELDSAGVSVTMGGTPVTAGVAIDGNTVTISITSVTGNVVITVPTINVGGDTPVGPTYDTATTAYLNATGISDTLIITRIDTMVKALKNAGLWNKIEALYPCVGTTFNQMSYNLKDPTTYRLTCDGIPTIVANDSMYHASAHIKSDIPTRIPGTDLHLMGCSGTGRDTLTLVCPTPSNGGATSGGGVAFMYGGSSDKITFRTATDHNWAVPLSNDNGTGIFLGSLNSGIVYNGVNMNATKTGNPSIANWVTDGRGFTHNGSNSSSDGSLNYSQKTRLSGFGHALTIEEMQTYSQILNAFKPTY